MKVKLKVSLRFTESDASDVELEKVFSVIFYF